jgi:hypothetical protein
MQHYWPITLSPSYDSKKIITISWNVQKYFNPKQKCLKIFEP